jgi:hypothetical protein
MNTPIKIGNMTILDVADVTTRVECHCGNKFHVYGLQYDDSDKPTTINNLITVDDEPIVCRKCDCKWRVGRSMPELPTEWKYFAMYVTLENSDGDVDEVTACLGYAISMWEFVARSNGDVLSEGKHNVKAVRFAELDRETFEKLSDAARLAESKSRFMGILSMLLG